MRTDRAEDPPNEELSHRLAAVAHYLALDLPERPAVGPVKDARTRRYHFALPGDPPCYVSFSEEFLQEHLPQEIPARLREWGLASLLLPGHRVTVTRTGLGIRRA